MPICNQRRNTMAALSLRLPDDLDHRLAEEAEREGLPRSEIARQAIADYLARCERERFMAELASEAKTGYAHEAIRREALELAEDAVAVSDEALARTEGRLAGEPWAEEQERWWK
jgi:predicted transcriptional regulator